MRQMQPSVERRMWLTPGRKPQHSICSCRKLWRFCSHQFWLFQSQSLRHRYTTSGKSESQECSYFSYSSSSNWYIPSSGPTNDTEHTIRAKLRVALAGETKIGGFTLIQKLCWCPQLWVYFYFWYLLLEQNHHWRQTFKAGTKWLVNLNHLEMRWLHINGITLTRNWRSVSCGAI